MAAIHVAALLAHPAVRAAIERTLAARGVRGDTMIAHIDPREAAMLKFMGGAGTINPRTGLRQFYAIGGDGSGGYSRGAAGSGNLGQGAGGGSADALGGGVGGGYGGGTGNQGGSGLGAAGGHSGESGAPGSAGSLYARNWAAPTVSGAGGGVPATINNMPAAQPFSLVPMMSSTATTDLTGGRFWALPSWATTPYQVGMAPSFYPTPGVNAALGAPGTGGGTVSGVSGVSGGGGGGVSGTTPSVGAIIGTTPVAAKSLADASNVTTAQAMAVARGDYSSLPGITAQPGSPQWYQQVLNGMASPVGRAIAQINRPAPGQSFQQRQAQLQGIQNIRAAGGTAPSGLLGGGGNR